MKYISKVDEWFLDRFQAFSNWVGRTWIIEGVNYKIAHSLLILAMFVLAGGTIWFFDGLAQVFVGVFLGGLVLTLYIDYLIEMNRDSGGDARKTPSHRLYVVRLGLWCLLLYEGPRIALSDELPTDIVFYFVFNVLMLLFLYFVACSALPPGKSKAGELFRRLFRKKAKVSSK
ncbi:hypothetical protein HQ571_06785 [Candidatus Kuenenbacteria bacterium]|nr:hypothetical protein [Candidatus Kuenenbacteria bacterium]